jgi:tRNA U34 5-methylaminomethyl-2-thiouridine-forming methyltransferase MnmC
LKRKIIITGDGSKTIQIEEWNEQYHSVHGAIQEARHVFIKHGLLFLNDNRSQSNNKTDSDPSVSILEMGFGTGLNAFLTLLRSERLALKINYTGLEAYPVIEEELQALNYTELIDKNASPVFKKLHQAPWEVQVDLSKNFKLLKRQLFFQDVTYEDKFDLIYFDAFGARVQPELWTQEIFQNMYKALKAEGVLVTYSAKGSVRRAMEAVGFKVERLPGPPGKREMLRALKVH